MLADAANHSMSHHRLNHETLPMIVRFDCIYQYCIVSLADYLTYHIQCIHIHALFHVDDFDNPTSLRRCHSGCIHPLYASRSCVELRKDKRIGYAFWNMLSCHSFTESSSTHMKNVFRCSTVFTDSSTIYPALGPTLVLKDYVERPSLMSSAEVHYRDALKSRQIGPCNSAPA